MRKNYSLAYEVSCLGPSRRSRKKHEDAWYKVAHKRPTFVLKLWVGDFGLCTLVWECWSGNFGLGTWVWELWLWNFGLGAL